MSSFYKFKTPVNQNMSLSFLNRDVDHEGGMNESDY